MHCDVNQKDIVSHIWECLNDIDVERIDHGINSLEDDALCAEIAKRELGLTICPVSNQFVVQTYTTDEIRSMLRKGMKPTINSDDPAYFRAYLNDNFEALVEHGNFSQSEILQLVKNSFEVSWLEPTDKNGYLSKLAELETC